MRAVLLALALVALPACTSFAVPPPATVQLAPAKALLVAEAAYAGMATTAFDATAAGLITGARAARLADLDAKAYAALEQARAGRASAAPVLALVATAQALVMGGE